MSSNEEIELLAPGGDVESIKAAILAGADAIYCGLDRFNARNRAVNISFDNLNGILGLAHRNNCKIFLTLNVIIVENEIPALTDLLNKLVNTSIDGVIIQDLGLFHILSNHFKRLEIHASTQLTTHNSGQIHFLRKLGAIRVNLSRELSITEIEQLSETAHKNDILTEVFVHGSNCISFSGLCYMSSANSGNSGNRGRCSQPCRDEYLTTSQGIHYPLNLKDNSAFCDLRELVAAGVDSIKIEGRIKKFHYVYTVVNAWRKQVDTFYNEDQVSDDKSELYSVFNRDFSNTFLQAEINKDMFIDNPRDHSALHLSANQGGPSATSLQDAKNKIYNLRTDIITDVEEKICNLSIAKAPLLIHVSGDVGSPLKLLVDTPETSFVVSSNLSLATTTTTPLSCEEIEKRLAPVNDSEYFIENIQFQNFAGDLFLPFKELTAIKNRLLYILNGSRETIPPVTIPHFKKQCSEKIRPTLSVLIDSIQDVPLCKSNSSGIYFQLPNVFKKKLSEFLALFRENQNLIPWFPSIIIGDEYTTAVQFLERSQAQCIVTNNTGIAYEASVRNIPWIAGPYLNTVNSFSLSCLKEQFNCEGAFISNELKRMQIMRIKKPDDFKLYYSIYHPITLMTSRQCLFHQVTGCEKNKIDTNCIEKCTRSASITNVKDKTYLIKKTKGNYHTIYNATNFMNTEIITDLPNLFSSFFIDLRDITTKTSIGADKAETIRLFENCVKGNAEAVAELQDIITPSTNTQYLKGI